MEPFPKEAVLGGVLKVAKGRGGPCNSEYLESVRFGPPSKASGPRETPKVPGAGIEGGHEIIAGKESDEDYRVGMRKSKPSHGDGHNGDITILGTDKVLAYHIVFIERRDGG